MNVLIIKAHPASYGFTHAIADTYKETAEQSGKVVEIIDLYNKDYEQSFLCFEDLRKDCGPTEVKTLFQDKISWADELVFISPIWQMGVPAIMKNFFDVNLTAGFAFKYTKEGLVKLLSQKRAQFFLTADGPSWIYKIYNPFLRYMTLGGFLSAYCGIKITSMVTFTEMRKKKNDQAREKMLNRVRKLAWKK